VLALSRIFISRPLISISPVGSSGLIFSSGLASTRPFIATTYSERNLLASLKVSSSFISGLKTTCTIPERSLNSMKIKPPKSLLLCTQPIKTTVSPTFVLFNLPHKCVLFKAHGSSDIINYSFLLLSKVLLQYFFQSDFLLLPSLHILDYCFALCQFIITKNYCIFHHEPVSCLQLAFHATLKIISLYPVTFIPQLIE